MPVCTIGMFISAELNKLLQLPKTHEIKIIYADSQVVEYVFLMGVWSWSLFIAWLRWLGYLPLSLGVNYLFNGFSSHLHFEFQMWHITKYIVVEGNCYIYIFLGPVLMYDGTLLGLNCNICVAWNFQVDGFYFCFVELSY